MDASEVTQLYSRRFGKGAEGRRVLWSTLCRSFFQRYVPSGATVVDMPSGSCDFINHIEADRRIAIDLSPDVVRYAGDGVETFVARSTELPAELAGTADVVFVSNFFEHLPDAEELLTTLRSIRTLLSPTGRLLVLQPNIRLTGAAYWDFIDHSLAITEKSLVEALEVTGFEVEELIVRFLPYTTESRLPIHPMLIEAYLKFRPAWRLLGKQTFAVARAAS